MTPIELKRECVMLHASGITAREIYHNVFIKKNPKPLSFESFQRSLRLWKKYEKVTDPMIDGASLSGFLKPSWGTVQVNAEGKPERAWLRGNSGEEWKEQIFEAIKQAKPILTVPPVTSPGSDKTLLEISFFDLHIGIADYNYYIPVQQQTDKQIRKGHDQIIFAIGSDMFHNNDHRGRTAKGTQIESVDMLKAFQDGLDFYVPLIKSAVEHSVKPVKAYYVKGNHDETASWYFVKYLSAIFPQVEFDLEFKEKKVFTWEKIFIGFTHGDKGKNALPMSFVQKWAQEWANAVVREIHTGHFHQLEAKDVYGTRVRVMPTANITDQWSEDNSFEGAVKEFLIFEYGPDRITGLHPIYAK